METFLEIFGRGKELTPLQMSVRTLCMFFICLLFIRLSGKRSFGMRMPLDNVITILLGAILSRGVAGASSFISTVAAGATIVILHRVCATLGVYSSLFGKMMKGESTLIYKDNQFIDKNMKKCMVTKKDLMEGLRINGNLDDFEKVKTIYVERNGEMSVVKKEK